MAFRHNPGGRPITYPKVPKTARDIMRRHMREENVRQGDFALFLGVTRSTVYDYFNRKSRPLAPGIIDAFIEWLHLDEFDALELRLLGARESGWQLEALTKHIVT